MTLAKQTVIKRLKELETLSHQPNQDLEDIHQEADDLLCAYLTAIGHPDVAMEFLTIKKWYA